MSQTPDRLYELLPAVYRIRDAEEGYPLRALLHVIEEQVEVVQNDIDQLYENWFIETCQDWVVPYIGDLIGYRAVADAGRPGDPNTEEGGLLNRVLIPRREVADTIQYRRRKGTLALLELLALDVAGWPARAVEFRQLLRYTQPLNHLRQDRGRTVNLRDGRALGRFGTAFDTLARLVEIRRPNSRRNMGRFNIPSVGIYVWRLKAYSVSGTTETESGVQVTATTAQCLEEIAPNCYSFSALGHDTRLFTRPELSAEPTETTGELSLPAPITRRGFDHAIVQHGQVVRHEGSPDYYGPSKSMAIWAPGWPAAGPDGLIPASAVVPADLDGWRYRPTRSHVLVDPERGRIVFPNGQLPRKGVRVRYYYGFSADMGGGEYTRPIPVTPRQGVPRFTVGERGQFNSVAKALAAWSQENPDEAVIEIIDSHVYTEQIAIELRERQSLTIRAANEKSPTLRLIDWQGDRPDSFGVEGLAGSRITLDGLIITGRSVQLSGDISCVTLRHCTLVPGWGTECDCAPSRPFEPSLELTSFTGRVEIAHSILGSVLVMQEKYAEPVSVRITDSILDATDHDQDALSAGDCCIAPVILRILRTTVFGQVLTHQIDLAENTIFAGLVTVARRQTGCVRFCYVPTGSRTPRRYNCQPDLVEAVVNGEFAANLDDRERPLALERERFRVEPLFNSERYGASTYCQLSDLCAEEIRRGADDESEMGAFHDLFQPQRTANLGARLDEYTPALSQAGIFHAT